MRRPGTLALAIAGALIAASCGSSGGGSTPTGPTTPPTGGGGGTQTTVTITITGQGGKLAFTPNPATIAPGQMVVFKNNDTVAHHVMLDDGTVQTPDIAPGATSAAVAMGTAAPTRITAPSIRAWSAASTARWRSLRRTAARPTASAVGNRPGSDPGRPGVARRGLTPAAWSARVGV